MCMCVYLCVCVCVVWADILHTKLHGAYTYTQTQTQKNAYYLYTKFEFSSTSPISPPLCPTSRTSRRKALAAEHSSVVYIFCKHLFPYTHPIADDARSLKYSTLFDYYFHLFRAASVCCVCSFARVVGGWFVCLCAGGMGNWTIFYGWHGICASVNVYEW